MLQNMMATPAPAYRIASVDHVLQLMVLLFQSTNLRVADAADHLGVARSTAHRLLAMLVFRGFARQDPHTRLYQPGPVLIEIGMGALINLDVRQRAQPFLERLALETGETASLQILEGDLVRFVDSVESTNAVRVGSRAGITMPAHASSGGKVLLAHLSQDMLQRLYPDATLARVYPTTTVARADLFAELTEIRHQGYAVEHQTGLVAAGVAVVDAQDRAVASLTVAGPSPRMDAVHVDAVVHELQVAAKELGRALYH